MANAQTWEIPKHRIVEFKKKRAAYCVCIPVINEGEKFQKQLRSMKSLSNIVDIIIADGGSTDGSTAEAFLKANGVRALLIKQDTGKLSAQLRMGFSYALKQGYKGIITIDGNAKDDPSTIPLFVKELEKGFGFLQGSRFIKGGVAKNTPLSRLLAVRILHAPLISIAARYPYTDTTNGFRGHSAEYLRDPRLQPFRTIFNTYELLAYLSIQPKKFGYRVKEIPVTRTYPSHQIPTKILGFSGNLHLLFILMKAIFGKYDPNH